MLEIFSDSSKYKKYKKTKKIYSYTNKKWVFFHDYIEALYELTTIHKIYLPWEFLEHHTENEISNFLGEKNYSYLSNKTSWIENSPSYKK